MEATRYVVGIDLGTTNSALAWVDTGAGAGQNTRVQVMAIPQLVHPGEVQERQLLPSFAYLPGSQDLPAGSLKLAWTSAQDYAVGELARLQGALVPRRLVASAKSWLCHGGVDRKAAILPWGSGDDVAKISPVEASTRYLAHLRDAWNHRMARDATAHRLELQEVYLTVPASFDAVARDLTMQAAAAAGLERVTLLEEPQAAFYAWLDAMGDAWRKEVRVGDVIFVCDIGGGTTDFSLIGAGEEGGNLTLQRLAVGEHILLGGDNMDLALAHSVKAKLEAKGNHLDMGQTLSLWHACRMAKERLLSEPECERLPVTVAGRGSRLVGGTLQAELSRDEVMKEILGGFFPACGAEDRPSAQRRAGFQELGLPYASDPAVPKHIARFLGESLKASEGRGRKGSSFVHPTAVLFNGGVLKSPSIQLQIVELLNRWLKAEGGKPARVLKGVDLDLAVGRGAAHYGLVRRGTGVRIRGGTARAYYVGVETAMPAVPGKRPPIKALCVVPFGMEEGSEADVPGPEFGLVVGEPAEFRFLSSTTRRGDQVGTLLETWEEEGIEELSPLETVLKGTGQEGSVLPVRLRSRVTEVGTLELWCVGRERSARWKLEFNVRAE
ncbi:MAG: Hsp70 family protein [Planctomycetes bacterium]|nr:Hsp70 family protein [Planctomycetota bacterium]